MFSQGLFIQCLSISGNHLEIINEGVQLYKIFIYSQMPVFYLLLVLLFLLLSFSAPQLALPLLISDSNSVKNQAHSRHFYNHTTTTPYQSNLDHTNRIQSSLQTDAYTFQMLVTVNGINYAMNLDTGSSDFIIKGDRMQGQPKAKVKSGDCCNKNQIYTLAYYDGQFRAYSTNASVVFVNRIFDANLLIGCQGSSNFDPIEGILGLSFPQQARHQPTFMQTLLSQNIINQYAYAINFNFIHKDRSFISLGGIDSDLYYGRLNYYYLSHENILMIGFRWLQLGDSKLMGCKNALLDTGNSCITIPSKHEDRILHAFASGGNRCRFLTEAVPQFRLLICKILSFEQLPVLRIAINKVIMKLQKEYYLQYCIKHSHKHYCVTYIESVTHGDTIVLGAGFFSRYFTHFDLQNMRVGIALNKQNITLQEVLNAPAQDKYEESDWAPVNQ